MSLSVIQAMTTEAVRKDRPALAVSKINLRWFMAVRLGAAAMRAAPFQSA
jgi:hypothetical protein